MIGGEPLLRLSFGRSPSLRFWKRPPVLGQSSLRFWEGRDWIPAWDPSGSPNALVALGAGRSTLSFSSCEGKASQTRR